MASFTLSAVGDDKSTIRRHLPGLCFLGMAPNGLIWSSEGPGLGCGSGMSLRSSTSHCRYAVMMSGMSYADLRLQSGVERVASYGTVVSGGEDASSASRSLVKRYFPLLKLLRLRVGGSRQGRDG